MHVDAFLSIRFEAYTHDTNDALLFCHLLQVTGDIPAVFLRMDYHMAWVNTAALAAAGLLEPDAHMDEPGIDRDEEGIPTGLLRCVVEAFFLCSACVYVEGAHMDVSGINIYAEGRPAGLLSDKRVCIDTKRG